MSSVQLGGSHTCCRLGGEAVGYQKRKYAKPTNMLFLVDGQGILLCISEPIAGNHHDLYEINNHFKFMCQMLVQAQIDSHGMVMNADAGFGSMSFRDLCDDLNMIDNIDINKRNSKNTD